jgi:elongation factor 1-alpha
MKNLITGLAQATAVILVVACNNPEYEIGIGSTGHTEEYARAAACLGIKNVVICVNKMDLVDYSEERFNFVVKEMTQMLVKKLGFREDLLTFIPISGYHGVNLVKKS